MSTPLLINRAFSHEKANRTNPLSSEQLQQAWDTFATVIQTELAQQNAIRLPKVGTLELKRFKFNNPGTRTPKDRVDKFKVRYSPYYRLEGRINEQLLGDPDGLIDGAKMTMNVTL